MNGILIYANGHHIKSSCIMVPRSTSRPSHGVNHHDAIILNKQTKTWAPENQLYMGVT